MSIANLLRDNLLDFENRPMPATPGFVIREAKTVKDRMQVYRFRYEVLVDEMGEFPNDADHQERTVLETLDARGIVLAAWFDNEIVGTLRINLYRDGGMGDFPKYFGLDQFDAMLWSGFSATSRFIVRKDFRKGSLANRLAIEAYERRLDLGVHFDFLDCVPQLLPYFQRFGYLEYSSMSCDRNFIGTVPMILPLYDLNHLKEVRSPLAKQLEGRLRAVSEMVAGIKREQRFQLI